MQSSNLSLPFLAASQAQKHVTVNEGIRVLDALVQLAVKESTRADPPATPAPGDRYIVASGTSGATGAWAGQEAQLAVYDDNAWVFYTPRAGWLAWDEGQGALLAWDGSAWAVAAGAPELENLPGLGVGTSSDATNRLAVASEATLLTHGGAGHQLKVNKATAGDTASLLFQTGWSGRAEMGLAGDDNFSIKTSADGAAFNTSLQADAATGTVSFPSGVAGLAPAEFGSSDLVTSEYVLSRGVDLVTNGTGLLGNTYNYPADFAFDPLTSPNLPGSAVFTGHHDSFVEMSEFLPIDPNKVYRLSVYLRQEGRAGDWSAYTNAERHLQYMGLICYDIDKQVISAPMHMRYRAGGTDSLTTLAAPLSPGDTTVSLTDAAGWNDTSSASYQRGITVFGYRNSLGGSYDYYSRHTAFSLFDTAGVDKLAHTITLNAPFPSYMRNPADVNGTWPAGTAIANSDAGNTYKYSFFSGFVPAVTDTWIAITNHAGGLDLSGTNEMSNFPPGTAYARVFWLPNYSNRPGGFSNYPDTGPDHRVWYAGVSVVPDPLAQTQRHPDGQVEIKAPQADYAAGSLSLVPAAMRVATLD